MSKENENPNENPTGDWRPSATVADEGLVRVRKITEKITGPAGPFTFDYSIDMDLLRIGMPLGMWCRARAAVGAAARTLGLKENETYLMKAVDLWAFISCFDWMREFPMKTVMKLLGITSTCFSYCVKTLEGSGLCVIDKSRKAANASARLRGKYYMWWPRPIQAISGDFTGDDVTWTGFMSLKGTDFGRMIDCYIGSCGSDILVPERIVTGEVYPEWVYVSPYYDLEYRYSGRSFRARMYESWWAAVAASRFGYDPVYKGRLYNGFHYMPGVLRKNIYYKGSPIVEAFDLHCSFYTLSVGLIKEKYPDTDARALEAFFRDCASGRLYDKCAEYTGHTRDEAKRLLQGWRNLTNRGTARHPAFGYSKIAEYMERNYPVISEIYYGWETRETEYGDKVKNLQRDLDEYETRVISELAFTLIDKYGVTPFTLHDAIYVSEADKDKLPIDIDEKIVNWLKNKVL